MSSLKISIESLLTQNPEMSWLSHGSKAIGTERAARLSTGLGQ